MMFNKPILEDTELQDSVHWTPQ